MFILFRFKYAKYECKLFALVESENNKLEENRQGNQGVPTSRQTCVQVNDGFRHRELVGPAPPD